MKILQVMAGAEHGGAETAFVDMCIALHEAGETIEAVTRKNDIRVPVLEKAGIRVHTLPFGGRFDVYSGWQMGKIIKKFQPQIVQTWMSRAAAHTPRWVPSMHIPRYSVVSRLGGYYKLKYFRTADFFTTITPGIRDYLITQGTPPEKVRHINNFAETEPVIASVDREAMGVPKNATLLLALGRLHPSKAFDVLIDAVADLPHVYAWIAGEGPERAALERQIEGRKVGTRIKLLGWRDDRAALLQACDICVFPSRYEPFGTVFVQAWAQQRPLIASTADGPRQFVRNGEDGILVPVDDAAALRDAIQHVIEDRTLATDMVRQGFARYMNEFTRDKTVREYLSLYHSL